MNHLFKPTTISKNISEQFIQRSENDLCKICERCGLTIYYNSSAKFDRFYFNDIEIYKDIGEEKYLKLSCEEFIIKNIIE